MDGCEILLGTTVQKPWFLIRFPNVNTVTNAMISQLRNGFCNHPQGRLADGVSLTKKKAPRFGSTTLSFRSRGSLRVFVSLGSDPEWFKITRVCPEMCLDGVYSQGAIQKPLEKKKSGQSYLEATWSHGAEGLVPSREDAKPHRKQEMQKGSSGTHVRQCLESPA